jgi:Trichodiene synthase (TRI5)
MAMIVRLSVPLTPSALVSHNKWISKFNILFNEDPSLFLCLLVAVIGLLLVFLWLLVLSPWRIRPIMSSWKNKRISEFISTPSQSELTYLDYEIIINEFLHEISFKRPILKIDHDLKSRVINRMKTQGVSLIIIEQVQRCIETAVTMTAYTYSFASPTVQEAIATFASYAISIDDLTRDFAVELQVYTTNLALGQLQRHPLLQGFTTHLSEQCHIFGAFGGDMIIKGALEFISSVRVEAEHNDNLHLPSDASDFLVFFRAKTGVAEPFAFFCFPEDTHPEARDLERYVATVPAIMLFLDYVNDLLSFYKEHKQAEDSASFVMSYAKLHQLSLLQSLQRLKEESVKVVKRIRNICAEDTALFCHLENFIQGYVLFHLAFGRYKLAELNIPLAIEASKGW